MELETTISKLNKYKSSIDETHLNDLLDFLYSEKIIDENDYFVVYRCKEKSLKLYELFKIIDFHSVEAGKVFKYLNKVFPNIERLLEEQQNFRISSVRGGFPKLPPNYVTRNALVEELKSKLLELKWNQKLVVYGMMGYGKSCLVNEVLNDISIRKYFDNCLFWINIGEHHNKDTVFQPLWRLYQTACEIINNKVTHCPDSTETLKDYLIKLFLDSRLRNALIILDDACSAEVLTYFDIRCKMVITTQHKKILNEGDNVFVEVKTGFSRCESLKLFKKSLSIKHDLPVAAEEIHQICKGHPMLIALIGSYLKDNAEGARNNNDEIWEYIRLMFSKGEYNLNEYSSLEVPTEKIKKCITQLLANGLKEYYHDLAIFMPDVNVPPEVLQVLWGKDRIEVRNIMNKFAEKSLVVPFYHKDLKRYIYGIHDIYLNYLKDVTQSRIVNLHKKLISGYDKTTGEDYSQLPNDNYTLQYIGYHLYHAEAFQKFDIYFNLKFLEAKIRAVGKEDVLRDMQKYEICITRNENILKEKLSQYKEFVNRCGNSIYSYEKTDIIQFALAEKKENVVYKEGYKLAQVSKNLYFQLQRPVDEYDNSTINVKDDITSACFVDSPHRILIGTASGKIKLFFEESEKEISNFVGHDGPVNQLTVSPDKRYFLSVSMDGSVMLWKFAADSARNSSDFSDCLLVSPKTKQRLWQDVFTSDRGQIKPRKQFCLTTEKDDYLISAGFCDQFPAVFRIVTGSNRGNVVVWDAETGDRIHQTGPRGYKVPSVIYLKRESHDKVIFACEDSILLYRFSETINCNTLHNPDPCKSIFLADNKIIAISEKSIILWENYKMNKIFEKTHGDKYHICATLTDDSNYLVVSTNLKTIFVWNFEERKLVKEFKSKGLAKSLDTFYDEDKSVHILLIGSDQRTLQQCHILPDDKEPKIADDFKFVPYWKRRHALTALVSRDNKIQVFNGSVQISETDVFESKITCTCFTACGQNVVFGLDNGEVHLFNVRHKKSMCIESNESKKHKSVTWLWCYDPINCRTKSISSAGSVDGFDYDIQFDGIVISVFDNDAVSVYYEEKILSRRVKKPTIYFSSYNLIVVDDECHIFVWNLISDFFSPVENCSILLEPVLAATSAYCAEKDLLGVVYKQDDKYCLDVYSIIENNSVKLNNRAKLEGRGVSASFSSDGSLLAIGMVSGDISVWNLNQNFKLVKLSLHIGPVEDLLFSPTMEPILVSVGETIAWWNLKPFQQIPKRRGRPRSIDLLENVTAEMSMMNLTYWSDRKCLEGTDYLLSRVNLHGRPRCLSASKDFNSFLTVDDKGKIYVMEIVASDLL